ncbi:E3 ubiquitin-protein ligase ZFP91-like isoform X1 [Cyclopterus lumpus]|uniref:E3 ubiquitin-protein ligase ZFP91 n=1 Tax=Cyclopterus lumpus TaxID=8103 RepID=A0A8C2X2E4_CYCLU|nr:E3 ubiquitin-protein ligase ZFP91-like isoform X1 [Cyclopterus lumpus]XP_034413370.1 E3 ubiquitin-protein ligase ZFP91-like isoform X1 [Cyclopterus lumpus]
MDSEEDEVSGIRPRIDIIGDSTEAAKPPSVSTEPPSGRRGSKRLVKTTVTSPDSGDSGSGVRVLRARRVEAGRTNVDKSKNATYRQTSNVKSMHRGRGRPLGSRSKNTQSAAKKSTAKNASKPTSGSKLSKAREGKGRPPTQASCTTTATACKPEAEMEAGEETGYLKASNDNVADPDAALDEDPPFRDDPNDLIYKPETKTEKSRRNTTLKQKEVKKEESEKDEEEDNIKKEESTEIVVQSEDGVDNNAEPPRKRGRQQKDDKVPRLPKQRKKPPVQYVRCEIEGCGTVLAHPRYLQHHIKYQHLLKKKYVCDHPSCGRLFRLQKQLLRHAKHHTDQRDYICEYCARAFKSSHNLAVHRMIHTGEKPIQCEICGFTCRQKASLNWHMKKHDAESSYQFSCSICGKKFEKKDSVVAHKAKSHPEVLIAEALAANGGSVISSPTLIPETVQVLAPTPETVSELNQPKQPSVSQENQEVVNSTLTPLQQVVHPLAPQTRIDVSQGQFLQLPTHHVVQVAHQQQAPTLLHLTAASPTNFSSISHPQLIQFSTLPASTVASMTIVDPQSTLLTLSSSSVTTLASTASLASQQAMQWGRETDEDEQLPGEGELWDRVVVGGGHQDVGEMMWEGNEERRKEDEGIVWEREGGRHILLHCAEVHGDSLI